MKLWIWELLTLMMIKMDKNLSSQMALSIEQMLELQTVGVDISDTRLAWCPLYSQAHPTTLIGYYLMDKDIAESDICATIWPTYTLEDIMLKMPLTEVRYNELMPKDRNWVASVCMKDQHFFNKSHADKTPLGAAFLALKWMAIAYPEKIIILQNDTNK